MKNQRQLLETVFNKASACDTFSIPEKIKDNLTLIADNSKKQKGVFTVLTTLLIHKMYDPNQDIRKHQSNMKNGFSGRRIDTQYITPTLKKLGLPAMAESGWLTRSLEQPYPYNLRYQGKIQDKKVKKAFLEIIDYIQNNRQKTEECAIFLIYSVKEIVKDKININKLTDKEDLYIEKVISFLDKCFNYPYKEHGGSKIPVIAVYSIFTILIEELERYKNCKLKPLGSHTASDKTSRTSGDIEILNASNSLEESIEVKFGRAIDPHLIRNIKDKIYKYNPKRYCVFSTKPIKSKNEVFQIASEIRKKHGCHLILNGILPTLKYYLRLVSSKRDFLNNFLKMIMDDSELQPTHKKIIKKLKKQFFKKSK